MKRVRVLPPAGAASFVAPTLAPLAAACKITTRPDSSCSPAHFWQPAMRTSWCLVGVPCPTRWLRR